MRIANLALIVSGLISLYLILGWVYYAIYGFLYPRPDLIFWLGLTAFCAFVRHSIQTGELRIER